MTIVIRDTVLDGTIIKQEKDPDHDNQMVITYERDGEYMRQFDARFYYTNGKTVLSVLSTETYWFPDEDYITPLRLDTETFDYPVPIELVMRGGIAEDISKRCTEIVKKDHMYMDLVAYVAAKYELSYEDAMEVLEDLVV